MLAHLLTIAFLMPTGTANAIELGLPAACTPGEDCFFQQFPDMAAGPEIRDPFCGHAAYDGHKGTDLRLLSMADMVRGIPVVAMAKGKVLRTRDGMPDALISTTAARERLAGRECGNGMVITHESGYETQYCHMRRDSLTVKSGDKVDAGEKLGEIGASGMAQFPHIHVAVRRDGDAIDPSTGRALDEGCAADGSESHPLFGPRVMKAIHGGRSRLLAFGLAGEVIRHDSLVRTGPPPTATGGAGATVAWGWFANLEAGDRIRIRIEGPGGGEPVEHTGEPVDRHKADYSAYVGRRGAPSPGRYEVGVALLRDGETVVERTKTVTVR